MKNGERNMREDAKEKNSNEICKKKIKRKIFKFYRQKGSQFA